jgi:hypothetical protein
MSSPARISRVYDVRNVQTHGERDAVVLQAITNVTDRRRVDGWWDASPGDRTQAIYDEIRRLDQARANGASGKTENLAMQTE